MAVAWRCRAVHNGRQPRADSAGQQMARRLDKKVVLHSWRKHPRSPTGRCSRPPDCRSARPRVVACSQVAMAAAVAVPGLMDRTDEPLLARVPSSSVPAAEAAGSSMYAKLKTAQRTMELLTIQVSSPVKAPAPGATGRERLCQRSGDCDAATARSPCPAPGSLPARLCPTHPACVSCRAVAGRGAISGSLIAALARAALLPSVAPVCCLRLARSALPPPPPPVPPAAVCPRPLSSTGGVHQGRDAKPEA